MNDDIRFKEYMTALSEIHRVEFSKTTIGIYWEILRPYSDQQCIEAFNRAMAGNKWMPKPAELVEYIKGNAQPIDDRALVVANDIVAHLNQYGGSAFPDLHGDQIAMHLMTHRWNYKPWASNVLESELKWWVKEFCDAYRAYGESETPIAIDAPEEIKKIIGGIG